MPTNPQIHQNANDLPANHQVLTSLDALIFSGNKRKRRQAAMPKPSITSLTGSEKPYTDVSSTVKFTA